MLAFNSRNYNLDHRILFGHNLQNRKYNMQFGKVEEPGTIKFKLPKDHPDTKIVLKKSKNKKPMNIFIGCAKWNKSDLKQFYPKGTKDELSYYAQQFNSVELNATFYKAPSKDQVELWKSKAAKNFKFCPKITNSISHFRRLNEVKLLVDNFCENIAAFDKNLGLVFLQLHDNFKPKDFNRIEKFIKEFPKGIPLGIEVRNEDWFSDKNASEKLFAILKKKNVANIIVDTAGRRDLLHMRLTNTTAFVRYVEANHLSDYKRLG